MKCFVDTSAFAALYHRDDEHHLSAKTIWADLKCHNTLLYTSHDVVGETIILVRRRVGFQQAVIVGNDLWQSPVLEVLRAEPHHDFLAWGLFQKYSDEELSFVDCLSFVFMRELHIQQALTFDSHFSQVGFEVLKV
jgi:predicted nucleic acid-binding protein